MLKKWLKISLLLSLALLGQVPVIQAQAEIACQQDVIVQVDDWLSKLSEKFYGDVLAFPAIFVATNTKAQVDSSYAAIEDANVIEPGWKLCVVEVETAEALLGFALENAPEVDRTPTNLTGAIKVGAAHDLSGPFALYTQSIRNGIELAVKGVNEGQLLGEGRLEIVWEDTAGDKDKAVEAFTRLIEEGVVAILGPTLSKSAFAAAPLAQAAGTPVIGSSNTAEGVTDIGNYIFRTNLPEAQLIAYTVQQAGEALDLQRVVILYDESNPFTLANYESFQAALAAEDIEVAGVFSFAKGETDFAASLTEIKTLAPDGIILSALPQEAVQIILQAKAQDMAEIPFIGDSNFNTPRIFDLSETPLDGVIFSAAWNLANPSGSVRQFVTDYEAEYGAPPDQFAAQAYTAVWVLANALRQADSTDRTEIRAALAELALIETPLGLFTFDEGRNPSHSPVLQRIEADEFSLFE